MLEDSNVTLKKKEEILNAYQDNPLLTDNKLSHMFQVSRQYIGRILKEYKRDEKHNVPILYFCKGRTITEIECETNISAPTIRKILRGFGERYELELRLRKEKALENAKAAKRNYITRRRIEEREEYEIMIGLMNQQYKNAVDMSTTKMITNRNIVEQNLGHYKYNKNRTYLVFSDDYILPESFPKRISCKVNIITTTCKKYEAGVDGTTIKK